jgi:hypothetical protein
MISFIIGGGITGRLAGQLWPDVLVLEKRSAKHSSGLTRSWGTNYLWKPLPGDSFRHRQFLVITTVDGQPATEASILAYKEKIGKATEARDDWGLQFRHVSVGYDLLSYPTCQMLGGSEIFDIDTYSKIIRYTFGTSVRQQAYDELISTIPLPQMISRCAGQWGREYFPSNPIFVTVQKATGLATEVRVNYISDPSVPHYRECYRDGTHQLESIVPIPDCKTILYPGKINRSSVSAECLEKLRQAGIYCFGRYATWEPNELVHQTYDKLLAFKERREYAI